MPEGPVVADAGPPIALSMAGSLYLLEKLYGQVLVPDEVFREIAEAGSGRDGANEVAAAAWLKRTGGKALAEPLLSMSLGPGESQVNLFGPRAGRASGHPRRPQSATDCGAGLSTSRQRQRGCPC